MADETPTTRRLPGIEIDPARCGGAPVLDGRRFKLAQLIAQIAEGMTAAQVADEFDLDPTVVTAALNSLALWLDHSDVPIWKREANDEPII